jgi:enamine deaminase RidA (YjgF/YER057c/UK114 family)
MVKSPLPNLLAAVTLLLTACTGQAPKPEFVVPPGAEMASEMFGYSQAVRVGHWVTVAGQAGINPKTLRFPDDFNEQVRFAFQNLETVLEASGATLADVVELTTYQVDMERFQDVVDIHNEVFGEHRPAWTALGVKALALPSMQFEVSARAWTKATKSAAKP